MLTASAISFPTCMRTIGSNDSSIKLSGRDAKSLFAVPSFSSPSKGPAEKSRSGLLVERDIGVTMAIRTRAKSCVAKHQCLAPVGEFSVFWFYGRLGIFTSKTPNYSQRSADGTVPYFSDFHCRVELVWEKRMW